MSRLPRNHLQWTPVMAPADKFKHQMHSGDWYGFVYDCKDTPQTDRAGGKPMLIEWEWNMRSKETPLWVQDNSLRWDDFDSWPEPIKLKLAPKRNAAAAAITPATAVAAPVQEDVFLSDSDQGKDTTGGGDGSSPHFKARARACNQSFHRQSSRARRHKGRISSP